MLDRELIRRQPDFVRAGIQRKGLDASIVDAFLSVDSDWRAARTKQDAALAESNKISKSIGALMAQGKRDEAEIAKTEASRLKAAIPELEAESRRLETKLRRIELEIPNLPNENVPEGKDEAENVVRREWGTKPTFGFPAKPHWEIADQHGLFDLPRGAKIAGSGFPVYTGLGARLQRALVSFCADRITGERGYSEVYPPAIVNRESLIGTGNLPKFEDDLYRTTDDLFLVPTAEVPITNLYRDEILEPARFPSDWRATPPAFGARRGRRARTRAGYSGSISSIKSRW